MKLLPKIRVWWDTHLPKDQGHGRYYKFTTYGRTNFTICETVVADSPHQARIFSDLENYK